MLKKTLREILKEKAISQQVVADALGINVTNIRRYDDLSKRSLDEIVIISKVTGIDMSELIGSSVDVSVEEGNIYTPRQVNEVSYGDLIIMNVPLVGQYAYGGYLCGYQDETYVAQLPKIPFVVDHEARGRYVAFEMRGDSMTDDTGRYIEGDILLCREVPQDLWCQTKLHMRKWDFVIVHKDGILIKRVVEHDVENHTLTLHSLNPLYKDRVIDLVDVRQIFNVVKLQRGMQI